MSTLVKDMGNWEHGEHYWKVFLESFLASLKQFKQNKQPAFTLLQRREV